MSNNRLKTKDGHQLAITENIVPGAKVTGIILHGFQSSRQGKTTLAAAEALTHAGLSTVAVDFFAHGDSDGDFKEMTIAKAVENVGAVIAHIHDNDPQQKIILLGGSFGGLVAQYAAVEFQNDIICLILRAPVSNWWELWKERITADEIKVWAESGTYTTKIREGLQTTTFGREFLDDIQREDIYSDFAPRIMVPTLIVHGADDEIVPLAQSEKLKKHIPMSDLVILPGVDHRFSGSDDMLAYQHHITNFLRKSRII